MAKPESVNLWKTGTRRIEGDILLFYTKNSPLSNHYPAEFRDDEYNTYNCMEQYLMYHKALFFKDSVMCARIMKAPRPIIHKALGRLVRNFDASAWRAVVPDILMRGLKAKFSQVLHCNIYLKSTSGLTLAEASRTDNFYGIGHSLCANEKYVSNQATWGNNLLGKCLMAVRADL